MRSHRRETICDDGVRTKFRMKTPSSWRGRWRIIEMEVWGKDYLDLVVPAHITFDDEAMGSFQFGTVNGWLDCRFSNAIAYRSSSSPGKGNDDSDLGCGRGWAKLDPEAGIEGQLFIHQSDDSSFKAIREATPKTQHSKAARSLIGNQEL